MRYTLLLLSVVLCAFAYTLADEDVQEINLFRTDAEKARRAAIQRVELEKHLAVIAEIDKRLAEIEAEKGIAKIDKLGERVERIDEQMRSQNEQISHAASGMDANFDTALRIDAKLGEYLRSRNQHDSRTAAEHLAEEHAALKKNAKLSAAVATEAARKSGEAIKAFREEVNELAETFDRLRRTPRTTHVNDCEAGRQATGYSRDFSVAVNYTLYDPRYIGVSWKLCAASHLSVGSIAEFSVDALHFAPDGSLERIESTNHHSTRCKHIGPDVRYTRRPPEACTHTQYRTAPRNDAVPGRATPAMECLTGDYRSIPITLTESGDFDWRVVLYDARGRPIGRLAATTRACDV